MDRRWRGRSAWGLPFALLVTVINPLVYQEGETLLVRGEVLGRRIDVTLEAVVAGALAGLRIIVIVAALWLLSIAVDPDALMRLFRRLSYRSALTAALATRLVPVLARDAARMSEPRAAARSPRPARGRPPRWPGALERAVDVAAALELRGYALAEGRAPAAAVVAARPARGDRRAGDRAGLRSRGDRGRRGQWRPTRVWSWPWGPRSSRCRRRSSCWPPLPSPGRGRAWGWRVPDPLALAERFTYTYPEGGPPGPA